MPVYATSFDTDTTDRVTITPEHAAAAVAAVLRIAAAWRLTNDELAVLLGRPGRSTLFQWKRGDVRRLPFDTLARISYLLGIWKALQILFPEPARADAWVRKPNALLGGQTALERMLGGHVVDLATVRALLDAARGDGA